MDERLYVTLPQTCPGCGTGNDAHYLASKLVGPPGPGSVSICAYCLTIGVYSESGIRLPTPEESRNIAADAEIQQAVAAANAWRRMLRAWGN